MKGKAREEEKKKRRLAKRDVERKTSKHRPRGIFISNATHERRKRG